MRPILIAAILLAAATADAYVPTATPSRSPTKTPTFTRTPTRTATPVATNDATPIYATFEAQVAIIIQTHTTPGSAPDPGMIATVMGTFAGTPNAIATEAWKNSIPTPTFTITLTPTITPTFTKTDTPAWATPIRGAIETITPMIQPAGGADVLATATVLVPTAVVGAVQTVDARTSTPTETFTATHTITPTFTSTYTQAWSTPIQGAIETITPMIIAGGDIGPVSTTVANQGTSLVAQATWNATMPIVQTAVANAAASVIARATIDATFIPMQTQVATNQAALQAQQTFVIPVATKAYEPAGGSNPVTSIISNVTCTNTANETKIFSMLLPANTTAAGTTWECLALANAAVTLTPNIIFRLRLGPDDLTGNITSAVTVVAASSVRDRYFGYQGLVTCRSTGAGGTVQGYAQVHSNLNTAATITNRGSLTSATVAMDTTANKYLVLSTQWSAASSNNAITVFNASMVTRKP